MTNLPVRNRTQPRWEGLLNEGIVEPKYQPKRLSCLRGAACFQSAFYKYLGTKWVKWKKKNWKKLTDRKTGWPVKKWSKWQCIKRVCDGTWQRVLLLIYELPFFFLIIFWKHKTNGDLFIFYYNHLFIFSFLLNRLFRNMFGWNLIDPIEMKWVMDDFRCCGCDNTNEWEFNSVNLKIKSNFSANFQSLSKTNRWCGQSFFFCFWESGSSTTYYCCRCSSSRVRL